MKKTKIIVLILIVFTGNPFSFNITFGDNIKSLDKYENILDTQSNYVSHSNNKKLKKSKLKKQLKKEIQNRKKYHKNLVIAYNQNFDNNYLELIKNNSILIDKLKNELKK